MTTTARPTISLAAVTAALARAKDVVEHGSDPAEVHDALAVQDALVALCHESYNALAQAAGAAAAQVAPAADRLSWRTPLEELRVQAALAEMELKDSAHEGAAVADGLLHAVDKAVAAAVSDLGGALTELRSELRRATAR
jgi:hypothetical protein